ncbi:cupin domain-containing protein [Gammaproteobacteria bacterium AB-CW1]|uniref:Cupin domain-containing protein n=2 Tax=Natronospira TaxID=2024969 RepID=A0AAP6MJE8_9GAMM|nr:cupin domain-containing protein [Gammaproteobacteria bacterium AB-CW1]
MIFRAAEAEAFDFVERCHISEWLNNEADPALSVARAAVAAGVTTRWHRLRGIAERYVVLSGEGEVDVAGLERQVVGPGDVVVIPADTAQRISNMGSEELVFLAICTPRFRPESYEDLDPDPMPDGEDQSRRS